MKTGIKSTFNQLLKSPVQFPVETFVGVAFFVLSLFRETLKINDIEWFFVPLIVFTFWLHGINKWLYIISGLLFIPLIGIKINLASDSETLYYVILPYIVAILLLFIGNKILSNKNFSLRARHNIIQLLLGGVITALLVIIISAIEYSFIYIFLLNDINDLYYDNTERYFGFMWSFLWFIVVPLLFFTILTKNEKERNEPSRFEKIVHEYILSPAIIIYTIILYVYFIKIVLIWELPKGGVANLVTGFIFVSILGLILQESNIRKTYSWFYNNFSMIAIPPLVLYWIGALYRINHYGFTEGRFYLMLAGALMTLFLIMLMWKRTRHYQLMTAILTASIIFFTYTPNINAKSIGLRSQLSRFEKLADELNLKNLQTGKLVRVVDVDEINKDSLLSSRYNEFASVVEYIKDSEGEAEFEKKYGSFDWRTYNFQFNDTTKTASLFSIEINLDKGYAVDLEDYNIMLDNDVYESPSDYDEVIVVKRDGNIVLKYPIKQLIQQDSSIIYDPAKLCIYKNDSLMLVMRSVYLSKGKFMHRYTDYSVFRKRK